MEILKLEEKASSYYRKLKPQKVAKFECVKSNDVTIKIDSDEYYYSNRNYKKTSKLGVLFLSLIMTIFMSFFACFLLIEHNNTINTQLLKVVEKVFTPKDFGKIKFVDTLGDFDKEAYAVLEGFSIPFSACLSTQVGETFLLNSPSEITVKCAGSGVVESIKTDEKTLKKSVTIRHKYDLKTEYYLLDNVGVKVGDKVEKNTILGLSFSMNVGFKITYKNSIVKGLEIVDGNLDFC